MLTWKEEQDLRKALLASIYPLKSKTFINAADVRTSANSDIQIEALIEDKQVVQVDSEAKDVSEKISTDLMTTVSQEVLSSRLSSRRGSSSSGSSAAYASTSNVGCPFTEDLITFLCLRGIATVYVVVILFFVLKSHCLNALLI